MEEKGFFAEKRNKELEKLYVEVQKKRGSDFDEEEFMSHQNRFKDRAKEHAKRGFFRKILDRNKEMNDEGFAWEEALRDNREYDKIWNTTLEVIKDSDPVLKKEMNAEYRESQEMLQTVLDHMKEKKNDPDGKGKERKILVLGLGGGMACCYGGGQMATLVHTGYMDTVDVAVGISGGACDIGFGLTGEKGVLKGCEIYYKQCATKKFLDFKRVRRIMNVGFLKDVFNGNEGNENALDVERVKGSKTEFFVQATNADTLKPELLDAKKIDDKDGIKGVVRAIYASMALPWFYRQKVEIDGKQYVDGAFESFPIENIVKRFKESHGITDILVLPQVPYEKMTGVEKEAKTANKIARFLPNKGSLETGSLTLATKMIKSRNNFLRALKYIQEKNGVHIGIAYPPDGSVIPIENDPKTVKAAIFSAAKKMCEQLGEKMDFELL